MITKDSIEAVRIDLWHQEIHIYRLCSMRPVQYVYRRHDLRIRHHFDRLVLQLLHIANENNYSVKVDKIPFNAAIIIEVNN